MSGKEKPKGYPLPLPRSAGFTLIEVMVGFVIIAILLIGMNQFWVVVAGQIDMLTVRQQAVFRLNGEMERLTQTYRAPPGPGLIEIGPNSTGYGTAPTGWVASSLITNPTYQNRTVYTAAIANLTTTDGTAADFARPVSATTPPETVASIYRLIYIFNPGAADDDESNVVWLDRELEIVARLSWHMDAIPDTGTGETEPCGEPATNSPVNQCFFVTAFLDFPLRFQDENNPLVAIPGVPVETITLQTIIGGRDE